MTARQVRDRKLEQVTWDVFRAESKTYPEAGIEFMDAFDYLEDPPEEYVKLQGGYSEAEGFQLLEQDELQPNIKFGSKYRAWCLNPVVYCAFLLRRFVVRGGKVMRLRLASLDEAASLAPDVQVVVNCSGIGFGDPEVFPIKGQTCLVSNPCDKTITQQNKDGSWTFIIPRPLEGGTIIGGTKEPHNWSETTSREKRIHLLTQAAKMYPAILNANSQFDVIRDIVGRRPERKGGLRLSSEPLHLSTAHNGKSGHRRVVTLIHAYGAGGAGYELCWGVAQEVAEMALEVAPLRSSL
ncbi:D-amino-acid oxidase [Ilyonectria robusta]